MPLHDSSLKRSIQERGHLACQQVVGVQTETPSTDVDDLTVVLVATAPMCMAYVYVYVHEYVCVCVYVPAYIFFIYGAHGVHNLYIYIYPAHN